MMNIYKL